MCCAFAAPTTCVYHIRKYMWMRAVHFGQRLSRYSVYRLRRCNSLHSPFTAPSTYEYHIRKCVWVRAIHFSTAECLHMWHIHQHVSVCCVPHSPRQLPVYIIYVNVCEWKPYISVKGCLNMVYRLQRFISLCCAFAAPTTCVYHICKCMWMKATYFCKRLSAYSVHRLRLSAYSVRFNVHRLRRFNVHRLRRFNLCTLYPDNIDYGVLMHIV